MKKTSQWELSRQSLDRILTENHYTPRAFIHALGSPSFTGLLRSIQPIAVPFLKALLGIKVYRHMLFKRRLEIQSYTFTYRSRAVDDRDTILSGRSTGTTTTTCSPAITRFVTERCIRLLLLDAKGHKNKERAHTYAFFVYYPPSGGLGVYPPKLSNRISASSTPRECKRSRTVLAIIGGPQR